MTRTSAKGSVTQCNCSCNLQHNSTPGRCKIGKYMFPSKVANIFLRNQTFVTNYASLRKRLGLQVARKIAPCDRAFTQTIF